jgi:peptidoglycan/LPS O-acetylase OafA/YrhL
MYFGALCAAALLTFLVGLAWFAARHCSLASSLSAALQQLRHWTATHHLHLLQRASFDAYLVGIPAGILILGFLLVLDRVSLSRDHPSLKIIRRIADGTFALYLFHLPIFLLFAAYIPYNRASSWQKLSIFAATIAIAVAIAIPLDLLKRWLRATAPRSLHLTQPSA